MSRKYTITFYRQAAPESGELQWRWSMESRGRIVGASTEGYDGRQDCIENCSSVTGFPFEKPPGAPTSFSFVRSRERDAKAEIPIRNDAGR